MTDLSTLAASLSEAQKRQIDKFTDLASIPQTAMDFRSVKPLRTRGIVEWSLKGVFLTPLGQQVRDHLERNG